MWRKLVFKEGCPKSFVPGFGQFAFCNSTWRRQDLALVADIVGYRYGAPYGGAFIRKVHKFSWHKMQLHRCSWGKGESRLCDPNSLPTTLALETSFYELTAIAIRHCGTEVCLVFQTLSSHYLEEHLIKYQLSMPLHLWFAHCGVEPFLLYCSLCSELRGKI